MTTAADIKRQIAAVNRRSAEVFTKTIPRKIERALTASAIVVGNKAIEYTPTEYGLLAMSQYREVRDNGAGGYFARIGILLMLQPFTKGLIGVQDLQSLNRARVGIVAPRTWLYLPLVERKRLSTCCAAFMLPGP